MNHGASPGALTRILQALAGVILAYLVTAHTLASYFAAHAPATALKLNSSEPVALTKLAEQVLPEVAGQPDAAQSDPSANDQGDPASPAQTPAQQPALESDQEGSRLEGFARLPRMQQQAESAASADPVTDAQRAEARQSIVTSLQQAILTNPLNAQALGLLGAVSIGANDDERAKTLMSAAAHRSGRIPLASYWLLKTEYENKNYPAALGHADRLLRSTPTNLPMVAPYLGRIADASVDDMTRVLAAAPPWRTRFFNSLKGNIKDARTPLNILLKLKETPAPPTPQEFGPYVTLLMENGLFDLAYGAWLQSLSAEQLTRAGFVYNGGFDYAPARYPSPFDWSLTSGKGALLDLTPVEGNNVLLMKFGPGRAEAVRVAQTTLLMPGDYTFSVRYKGEIKARRGLRWTVQCAGKTADKLVESDIINGAIRNWTQIKLDFTVPADGCRPQQIKLLIDARSASEMFVSGALLWDDVSILRQGQTPDAG